MNTKVVTFVLLMHLVVPSIVKTEMCACPDIYRTAGSCREALQAELTSKPANIQQLQNLYFSPLLFPPTTLISTNMTISVSSTSEFLPVHNSFLWTHHWYEDNLASIITELIPTDSGLANILLFDPVAFLLQPSALTNLWLQREPGCLQLNIHLNCTSRGEPIQVDEEALRDIWEGILQWVSIEAHNYLSLARPDVPFCQEIVWERDYNYL